MRKKVFKRKIEPKTLEVMVNEKPYKVEVRYSENRRTLSLRTGKTGFVCNAPTFRKEKEIVDFVISAIPKLERRIKPKPQSSEGDNVWIFGEKVLIPGYASLTKEKQNLILKRYLLSFLKEVNPIHERNMGIETSYEVKVRDCKTVYGVHHTQKRYITYSLELVHYKKDTIESVVSHELAHHYVHAHSKKFYTILLKECPNYWYYRRKLIHHIYD